MTICGSIVGSFSKFVFPVFTIAAECDDLVDIIKTSFTPDARKDNEAVITQLKARLLFQLNDIIRLVSKEVERIRTHKECGCIGQLLQFEQIGNF